MPYKCPKCIVILNEVCLGEYKCPKCDWNLTETYVQAWWHGYNARDEEHCKCTPANQNIIRSYSSPFCSLCGKHHG